jgi:hypothetical protein
MICRGEGGWVIAFPPQVSTTNRTRATIKALLSPLHRPRPYGLTSTLPINLPVKAPLPPPTRQERGVLQYSLTIRLEELT